MQAKFKEDIYLYASIFLDSQIELACINWKRRNMARGTATDD